MTNAKLRDDDGPDRYFVSQKSFGPLIGTWSKQEIADRVASGWLREDCVATVATGKYSDLKQLRNVEWVPVPRLVAESTLQAAAGGRPGETSAAKPAASANPRKVRSLLVACVCAGISLFFLLKGEDSAFSFFGGGKMSGESEVSAFTYYVIWSNSKRRHASSSESYGYNLFYNNPYSPYKETPGSPTVTLPELMARNARIATLFGLVAAFAFWLSRTAKRPLPDAEKELPPIFKQQHTPESQDSGTITGIQGTTGANKKKDAG
jgi:hypothetical protein